MSLLARRSVLCLERSHAASIRRLYATELPRPPPPKQPPVIETIEAASRPRQYYARPSRELPRTRKAWPVVTAVVVVGVGIWYSFLTFVTNQEKISSSVVKQIMRTVRENEELAQILGSAIRPEAEWWLNGDPRIHGNIRQLQGNVDLSFRLKGSKGSGTVYFTSVRKEKGEPFTILRFRVIADNGTVINVPIDSPASGSPI